MATKKKESIKQLGDREVAERLQSILINAAEGQRSLGDDRQYPILRKELISRPFAKPSIVSLHPSVDSFSASIRGIKNRIVRVERVREDFGEVWRAIEDQPPVIDSSMWTGVEGRAARAKLVRGLLPLAQNAVDSMITELSEPNANGAPLLDSRVEAIEELRKLHQALGELLKAVDNGHLDDELGENIQAEVARFAKRAAKALRDDPLPYLSSALLLGLFTACGIPGLGGYLSGIALTVKKHASRG